MHRQVRIEAGGGQIGCRFTRIKKAWANEGKGLTFLAKTRGVAGPQAAATACKKA